MVTSLMDLYPNSRDGKIDMLNREALKKEYEYLYDDATKEEEAIRRFVELVKVLRKKCPWDIEQTHESLRRGFIEESYEVVEAINKNNFENLKEELGDVLLQIIFHSDLAREEGEFDLTDVINYACVKMINRHPHVFSTGTAKTVDKVLEKWENIKSKEHGNITHTERLKDVPEALPALIRGEKVQKRAADVGFDWDTIEPAIDKVKEELEEFCKAREESNQKAMQEELGDLLFSVVNVSRFAKIDSEEALNLATEKFINRFSLLEHAAIESGRNLKDMTLEEMDALWDEIKSQRANF